MLRTKDTGVLLKRKKMKNLLIILILLPTLVYGCASDEKITGYKDITSEELNNLMNEQDIFLVDVHIPEQKHIKGTDAFIPYNEIEQNTGRLPKDKNAKIALYCRSGSMSKTAAETLAKLGYKNVYNHLGGTIDWANKGFELE